MRHRGSRWTRDLFDALAGILVAGGIGWIAAVATSAQSFWVRFLPAILMFVVGAGIYLARFLGPGPRHEMLTRVIADGNALLGAPMSLSVIEEIGAWRQLTRDALREHFGTETAVGFVEIQRRVRGGRLVELGAQVAYLEELREKHS